MGNRYEFHPIAKIFPMMNEDELQSLIYDIQTNGLKETVLLYEGKILDGRNRAEACWKLGIEFATKIFTGTFEEAIAYVWSYNFVRRHLNSSQAAMAGSMRDTLLHEFNETREAAKERQEATIPQKGQKGFRSVGEIIPPHSGQPDLFQEVFKEKPTQKKKKSSVLKTREVRAVAYGTNPKYVDAADKIRDTNPELGEEILRGEKTIPQALRELKKKEVKAKLESISEQKIKEISGVYDVIVVDPPWPMEKIDRDVRPNQVDFDYPTMTEEQLKEFKIPSYSDCHLWCWTTQKFLPMAFRLINHWEFRYICTFVWHKSGGIQPIGLPQYNCEFILYARKGTPQFIDTKSFFTCFNADRHGHSVKPEEFYDTVRRVTVGRRIDIFSRRKIDGFDSWGNESE